MSESPETEISQKSPPELLWKNNPFTSCSESAEHGRNAFPEIASINRLAFEGILALIGQKAANPRLPLAGLILGEAGEGKTHLLCRIPETCRKTLASLFVFVRPLFPQKCPYQHLLKEMVLCLSKNSEVEIGFSQFERLIAEIIREYVRYRVTTDPRCATQGNISFLEQFEANVFHIYDKEKVKARLMEEIISDRVSPVSLEIIEKNAIRYVYSLEPETMSRQFLDVIFQYKTPEKRSMVLDWLKGNVLNEEDCEILGIPPRQETSDEAKEQEAREMILTLGVLFARYRLPMVICFDQLDEYSRQPELIPGFASMIDLLVNEAASMLPLAFLKWDLWYDHVSLPPRMDISTKHRLENNVFRLTLCRQSEIKELISSRIEYVFGKGTDETRATEKWLFSRWESKQSNTQSFSPRNVIELANKMIAEAVGNSQPKLPPISESLAAEYKVACQTVAEDFDRWNPDSEYLKRAAELFLTNQESVLSCGPGDDKYVSWTGTLKTADEAPNGRGTPYACCINTAKYWQTIQAALDRCLTFLKNHPGSLCTYVTDARCDFSPTWKATIARREEFESLGGNVVILDQPAAVRWYGLVSLAWKIGSGDILLEDEHGLRTATHKDLANFLKTEFSAHAPEGTFDRIIKKKVTPPPPPPLEQTPPDQLIEAVRACLGECTFPVQKMEFVLANLHEKGINVTLEYCLEQIGKNQNVISLIPIKGGYMVKLVV